MPQSPRRLDRHRARRAAEGDHRARFAGKSLDDFMRLLWARHGRTERPYTLADVESALGLESGGPPAPVYDVDALRHVDEGADTLLARAGLLLRPAHPGKVWLGPVGLREQDSTLAVMSSPTIGSPLYEAGVERGDRIVSIAGRAMLTSADLDAVLSDRKGGTTVPAVIIGREGRREVTIPLAEDFTLEIVTFEKAGRPVSKEVVAFRSDWMGSKAGTRK